LSAGTVTACTIPCCKHLILGNKTINVQTQSHSLAHFMHILPLASNRGFSFSKYFAVQKVTNLVQISQSTLVLQSCEEIIVTPFSHNFLFSVLAVVALYIYLAVSTATYSQKCVCYISV
jgi:hypothetical protein